MKARNAPIRKLRGSRPVWPRVGVTLIEMLVVVALTVLLMSIIAEVFALASQTLRQLRAISDSNLKSRSVEATLRRDLGNRTIREVQPPVERIVYGAGSDGVMGTADDDYYFLPVGIDPSKNLGYFMFSEGMPSDEQGEDIDDVLAFTVRLNASSQLGLAGAGSAFSGRAILGSEPDNAFLPIGDGLAGSQEAEIVYFLRRGTLYRRVLLVGVPQPSDTTALNPSRFASPQSWYANYSLSARPPISFPDIPTVNSLGDLSYRSTRYGHRPPTAYSTGDTTTEPPIFPGLAADHPADLLFLTNGYSAGPLPATAVVTGGPTSTNGSSLEYDDSNRNLRHDAATASDHLDHNHNYPFVTSSPLSLAEFFFGRPTQRETSAFNPAGGGTWDYPNNPASNVWASFSNSASAKYFDRLSANATLPAEDAVLTNVISFDVKIWDEDAIPNPQRRPISGIAPPLSVQDATGAYVDLGKAANAPASAPGTREPSYDAVGPYPSSGTPFGPPSLTCSIFTSGVLAAPFNFNYFPRGKYPRPGVWPPARGVGLGPDLKPGGNGDDDSDTFPENATEVGWPGTDDDLVPLSEPEFPAVLGSVGFSLPPGIVGHRRGFAMPYGTLLPDGTLNNPTNNPMYFDFVIAPGTPGFPLGMLRAPAALARTYDTWCSAYTKPSQFWQDTNGTTFLDKGDVGMPVAPPYIVPIRGIQIKIRFVDPDSRLTREVTIVQELR